MIKMFTLLHCDVMSCDEQGTCCSKFLIELWTTENVKQSKITCIPTLPYPLALDDDNQVLAVLSKLPRRGRANGRKRLLRVLGS